MSKVVPDGMPLQEDRRLPLAGAQGYNRSCSAGHRCAASLIMVGRSKAVGLVRSHLSDKLGGWVCTNGGIG